MKYWDIDDIKSANRVRGFHWFEPGAMRFFRSRISPTVYQGQGGVYFISSEQFSAQSERMYTVRRFNPETGNIETIGEFNTLTRSRAISLAKKCAHNSFGVSETLKKSRGAA